MSLLAAGVEGYPLPPLSHADVAWVTQARRIGNRP